MPEEFDPNWEYWEGDPEVAEVLAEAAEVRRGTADLYNVGAYTPRPGGVRAGSKTDRRKGVVTLYQYACPAPGCGRSFKSDSPNRNCCSRRCAGDLKFLLRRAGYIRPFRCTGCGAPGVASTFGGDRKKRYCCYECNPSSRCRRAPPRVPLVLTRAEARYFLLRRLPADEVYPLVPNEHRDELREWFVSTGVSGMAERRVLPTRRRNITQKVRVDGQTVYYTIGLYEDGSPGELFIDVAKAGAALRAWAGEAGMMLSVAVQHGTPLSTILDLFIGTRNDPCGPVEGHARIKRCSSIMDLIARDLAITFLGRDELANSEDEADAPHFVAIPGSNREHGRIECRCAEDVQRSTSNGTPVPPVREAELHPREEDVRGVSGGAAGEGGGEESPGDVHLSGVLGGGGSGEEDVPEPPPGPPPLQPGEEEEGSGEGA